jgi:hypothetical protein
VEAINPEGQLTRVRGMVEWGMGEVLGPKEQCRKLSVCKQCPYYASTSKTLHDCTCDHLVFLENVNCVTQVYEGATRRRYEARPLPNGCRLRLEQTVAIQ